MRKSKTITISSEGRDKGKKFVLTEMSAFELEEWAAGVLAALIKSGVSFPENPNIADLGKKLSEDGLKILKNVDFIGLKPSFDKLLSCVEFVSGTGANTLLSDKKAVDETIEEVSTLLTLKIEVLKLHFDFFKNGGDST